MKKSTEQFSIASTGTISTASQHVSPLRGQLMQRLASEKGQPVSLKRIANEMNKFTEDDLAKALVEGTKDGIMDFDDDNVWLTNIGQRAAQALY